MKFWPFGRSKKKDDKNAKYNTIVTPTSNPDDTRLWEMPTPDLENARDQHGQTDHQRLQRRVPQRVNKTRKIRKEDLVHVVSRTDGGVTPDLFEDSTIAGKAIVLKMPERSMKTYFIPLPTDLDGMKRRAVELFGLMDELDVFARLEFELFAFGVIPTSASLPLLRDREVVYVNLLPPRPPTPFSLTLAPPRAENSLVAEVRRPGTGLPYEVVYTQETMAPPDHGQNYSYEHSERSLDLAPSKPDRKGSRFKEHMSENGSRHSRGVSIGELEVPLSPGKMKPRSPNKVWYKAPKDGGSGATSQKTEDPFQENLIQEPTT